MSLKKIKIVLLLLLFYQSPLYSKSNSLDNLNSKFLSSYFSGIVAFENKNNSEALEFLNSSKILINRHEPYLERYVYSLVLEKKIKDAINVIKKNKDKKNSNFFDANLLLILDSLKKNELDNAYKYLSRKFFEDPTDRFNLAILETLKQYIYTFKEKRILKDKKNFGKLSLISETFQRCYLGDSKTDTFFTNLINDNEADYTRYIYFFLSYLVENERNSEVKNIIDDLEVINTTLLLSQGKSWILNNNSEKLVDVFSCKNHSDVISEFLFLISNLYSSQDNFEKSNFYLNLSNYMNPKFVFNLSLVAENHYLNNEFKKAKAVLKNFKEEDNFYYWYRVKKESQIIAKERNKIESLNYIRAEFNKIDEPNNKILFDIANFNKNQKEYKEAIKYYSMIINQLDENSDIKSDLLYRRGGSYERLGDYENSDRDLLNSLKINPDDAYVLNYLAYSWLERDYKIDKAIEMLENAYASRSNDPYIIDSIGWAYFLTDDYVKAETYLKRAVELMPDDAIVNDHYGDILWKLGRKIQARYFWKSVSKMEDVDEELLQKINQKIIKGL